MIEQRNEEHAELAEEYAELEDFCFEQIKTEL